MLRSTGAILPFSGSLDITIQEVFKGVLLVAIRAMVPFEFSSRMGRVASGVTDLLMGVTFSSSVSVLSVHGA